MDLLGKHVTPTPDALNALKRMNFLWTAAHQCAVTMPLIAQRYLAEMRDLACLTEIDLDPSVKASFCNYCAAFIIPGVTGSIRVVRARKSARSNPGTSRQNQNQNQNPYTPSSSFSRKNNNPPPPPQLPIHSDLQITCKTCGKYSRIPAGFSDQHQLQLLSDSITQTQSNNNPLSTPLTSSSGLTTPISSPPPPPQSKKSKQKERQKDRRAQMRLLAEQSNVNPLKRKPKDNKPSFATSLFFQLQCDDSNLAQQEAIPEALRRPSTSLGDSKLNTKSPSSGSVNPASTTSTATPVKASSTSDLKLPRTLPKALPKTLPKKLPTRINTPKTPKTPLNSLFGNGSLGFLTPKTPGSSSGSSGNTGGISSSSTPGSTGSKRKRRRAGGGGEKQAEASPMSSSQGLYDLIQSFK